MSGKATVVLSTIVRDEAAVIRRCLASLCPLIDRWVVVDTGSTDGTQALVRDALATCGRRALLASRTGRRGPPHVSTAARPPPP